MELLCQIIFKLSPSGIVVGGLDPARSTKDDQLMVPPMKGGKKKRRSNKQKRGKKTKRWIFPRNNEFRERCSI